MLRAHRGSHPAMTKYMPLAGTDSADAGWITDSSDPFTLHMQAEGFEMHRKPDGSPLFNWSGKLGGLWWQGIRVWMDAAEELEVVLSELPYEERNLIAVSHGGQPALLLASLGFPIRTLTTVGTPRRPGDINAAKAAKNILYWQHIYDADKDWMATLKRYGLGGLGDWAFNTDRSFKVPRVVNHPVSGIHHWDVIKRPELFHLWQERGWLEAIRKPDIGWAA